MLLRAAVRGDNEITDESPISFCEIRLTKNAFGEIRMAKNEQSQSLGGLVRVKLEKFNNSQNVQN